MFCPSPWVPSTSVQLSNSSCVSPCVYIAVCAVLGSDRTTVYSCRPVHKGGGHLLRVVCTPSFTAVPVGLSRACADRFPSSKWIDLEDPILFSVQFRHTPTHRGSLAELAKSSASYVSGSRSRYVGRGGTLCKEESCRECRCGPLSCWDYPHTIAPCGTWELDSSGRTSTAAPATTC